MVLLDFGRFKERMVKKKAAKKAEKERIQKITDELKEVHEKEFIEKKVKLDLSRKYTPIEFKLSKAAKKKELEKAIGKKPSLFGTVPGQTSSGDQILRGLSGLGPVETAKKPPAKKKTKKIKTKRVFFIGT